MRKIFAWLLTLSLILAVLPAGEYPFQLVDAELVGIRLQHGLPTGQAHHGNAVNVGMLLEGLHGVDDDRTVVNVHKLFWNVLSHAVAGTTGYDECVVHTCKFFCKGTKYFIIIFYLCRKISNYETTS